MKSVPKSCLLATALLKAAERIMQGTYLSRYGSGTTVPLQAHRGMVRAGEQLYSHTFFSGCCFSIAQYTLLLPLLNFCPPYSYIWELLFLFSRLAYFLTNLKI